MIGTVAKTSEKASSIWASDGVCSCPVAGKWCSLNLTLEEITIRLEVLSHSQNAFDPASNPTRIMCLAVGSSFDAL